MKTMVNQGLGVVTGTGKRFDTEIAGKLASKFLKTVEEGRRVASMGSVIMKTEDPEKIEEEEGSEKSKEEFMGFDTEAWLNEKS